MARKRKHKTNTPPKQTSTDAQAPPAHTGRNMAIIALLVVAVLAGGTLVKWWSYSKNATATTAPAETAVLIIVDTMRADALGCYGHASNHTPRLDALAAEGVRFEQAISCSGWTLPAVSSIFTGTWPPIHGAIGKATQLRRIRDEVPTGAEILKAAGFNTLGIANAAFVSPKLGLARGFDVFDHHDAYNWNVRRADETIDVAIKLLREQRGERNFLMVHLFDPHLNYDPPAEYATRFVGQRTDPPLPLTMDACLDLKQGENLPPTDADIAYVRGIYDAEVAYTDDQIGRLIDELKTQGLYDQATIIITADHGEEFWEHNGFEHGHTQYDELVHVPLIVKPPADTPITQHDVATQVRTLDIMPTLFALYAIQQPPSFVGEPLLPLAEGAGGPDRIALSDSTLYGGKKAALRTSQYKYIYDFASQSGQGGELYDWRADPGEANNLTPTQTQLAVQMHKQLQQFYEQLVTQARQMSTPAEVDMTPQDRRILESLGYIRGSEPEDD